MLPLKDQQTVFCEQKIKFWWVFPLINHCFYLQKQEARDPRANKRAECYKLVNTAKVCPDLHAYLQFFLALCPVFNSM